MEHFPLQQFHHAMLPHVKTHECSKMERHGLDSTFDHKFERNSSEEDSEHDRLYVYVGHVKYGQFFGKCSQLSYS